MRTDTLNGRDIRLWADRSRGVHEGEWIDGESREQRNWRHEMEDKNSHKLHRMHNKLCKHKAVQEYYDVQGAQ